MQVRPPLDIQYTMDQLIQSHPQLIWNQRSLEWIDGPLVHLYVARVMVAFPLMAKLNLDILAEHLRLRLCHTVDLRPE